MAESSSNARLEADLRDQSRRYQRLDPEVEAALLDRRDGDAVDTLVKHNLDLVAAQADAHRDQGLGFADLYQEGNLGLVDAIVAYEGSGTFRDFARLHIGLQMDSLVENEAAARREAEADTDDVRALDLAQAALVRELGRAATAEEMVAALGWDMDRLEKVMANLGHARQQNDAATITFLDDDHTDQLGIDFTDGDPDQPDPRRRPQGAGPDE
jgi:DNA-directed RNA polymerase sigma subunit (sigma70/sigma32)